MRDNFQVIIIVFFIITAIFGVLVFSGAIPLGGGGEEFAGQGTVVLWGTISTQIISPILEEFNALHDSYRVEYEEKNEETFDQDLLEALASGTGPDLFLLPDDLAFHYSNKIIKVPYTSYPIASFQSNFSGAGEVFLTSEGIIAYPLIVDPMVMFYNRSYLDANNIVTLPKDWDEFISIVPLLTKKDEAGKIVKSAVALGHFANVSHAKDILATLFMQAGDRIVREEAGSYSPGFAQNQGLESVLTFYTDFADPLKTVYSWNRSFTNSRDYFSTENLAFYFGFASEMEALAERNPNQNFLVTTMPQIKGANFKLTGADVLGVAISSSSKNLNTAFLAAGQMAAGDLPKKLSDALGIAPARRDLLTQVPSDPFSPAFYASALYARTFLDPSAADTDNIFRTMVDSVLSNRMTPAQALRDAEAKMGLLLIR